MPMPRELIGCPFSLQPTYVKSTLLPFLSCTALARSIRLLLRLDSALLPTALESYPPPFPGLPLNPLAAGIGGGGGKPEIISGGSGVFPTTGGGPEGGPSTTFCRCFSAASAASLLSVLRQCSSP